MQKSRKRENWVVYKNVCIKMKSVVSNAKHNKYDVLYEWLGTQNGEKEIYGLTKM